MWVIALIVVCDLSGCLMGKRDDANPARWTTGTTQEACEAKAIRGVRDSYAEQGVEKYLISVEARCERLGA